MAETIGGICLPSPDGTEEFVWRLETLWAAVEGLPVEIVPTESLGHFLDRAQTSWYGGPVPTVRDFMDHAHRFEAADLAYPLIVSAEGRLLDGRHRLAKATMRGVAEVAVIRFTQNPEPDWRRPRE